MTRLSRSLALACAAGLTVTLSACGSATVESGSNSGVPTTVAPLERDTEATSAPSAAADTATDTDSSATAAATKSETASEAASASAAKQDSGAKEEKLTALPTPNSVTKADEPYLDALRNAGINVEGVEDQLISAGHAACRPEDKVTVPAVAGQLLEQHRTDIAHELVSALIVENAQRAYCKPQ